MLSLPYISLDLLINFFKVFSLAVIILLYHLKFLNIAISANKKSPVQTYQIDSLSASEDFL